MMERDKVMDSSHRKKICLVSFSDNYDHQTAVYSLYSSLSPDCDVSTIGLIDPKASFPDTPNNYLFECPKRPGVTKGSFAFKTVRKIVDRLMKDRVDVVYFESVHLWNLFVVLLLPKKITVISTIHDVIPHDGSKAVSTLQRALCKLSDQIVVKSRSSVDVLADQYKIPKRKVKYLPIWHSFPNYQSPGNMTNVFLFFGRLKKYKGVHFLPEIVQKCPCAHFVIAGEADEYSRPLVKELELYDNVTVVDGVINPDTMDRLFKNCAWVILPYLSATQSGVVVDSYERSRPVIAFEVGNLSEQVRDGETGFLVPEGDLEAFSSRINEVCGFGLERVSWYAKNAYNFGIENYSSQSIAQHFAEVFGL
ncbi:MAG: glycosyltransferase family 4 protein [Eggerthellaceae bacterium]|uniref:glycosyltransferase family 4 protein n=2 Tax=uncultured Adlercreutzia sp. TaxID=875803 RepID=UPI003454C952|nr:glycosyltransferase family 4 protein [Eggerthellaceae bacterium]